MEITITMVTDLFIRFSSRDNLKKAYQRVQYELAHATLAVAPIHHAATTAINDLGDHFFIALENYLRNDDYSPERGFFVYIPKDNLGLRPVCILSMIDRIVYQAILNQGILGFKIDAQLSEKVCFANRINDDEKSDQYLSPYFNQWDGFCESQEKAFTDGYAWKLDVDVQQYYENISIKKLIHKLGTDFNIKNEKLLALLEKILCQSTEDPEMPKGIPQGPYASAVLANVYLAALDRFAEEQLIGEKLRYLRYADDIILMGKDKTDVLTATEKIVRFLREQNLSLNEKTRLEELTDTTEIEGARIFSEYDPDTQEIPTDEHSEIQERVPYIVAAMRNQEHVEKREVRELKYFLATGANYDLGFVLDLVKIIPLRPSLITQIIRYLGEARNHLDLFGDSMDTILIDTALWEIYETEGTSEWTRFWILKLFVSSKNLMVSIDDEIAKILSSKNKTIFKVVAFFHQTIEGKTINADRIKDAMRESATNVEKSVLSFFFLNAFVNLRASVIHDSIETALDAKSNEMNLIGCYLNKNSAADVKSADGIFTSYILNPSGKKEKEHAGSKEKQGQDVDYYIIAKTSLIPLDSPAAVLGVNRRKRIKSSVILAFPEMVQWKKVEIKFKEGLQEIEIWYSGDFIGTHDYTELGFYSGEKEKKPDQKWKFLSVLSVICNAGKIEEATVANMANGLSEGAGKKIRSASVHQIKRSLVKALRATFQTDENPFYKNRNYYHPKFRLKPVPTLRTATLRKQGGRLNENAEPESEDEMFPV